MSLLFEYISCVLQEAELTSSLQDAFNAFKDKFKEMYNFGRCLRGNGNVIVSSQYLVIIIIYDIFNSELQFVFDNNYGTDETVNLSAKQLRIITQTAENIDEFFALAKQIGTHRRLLSFVVGRILWD